MTVHEVSHDVSRPTRRVAVALAAGLAGAAIALGACGGATATAPGAGAATPSGAASPTTKDALATGAYVGQVPDSDVFIAVVPGQDSVRAYACNGVDPLTATINQWFEGQWDGTGPVTLRGGAYRLTVRTAGTGFAGELAGPRGPALRYSAEKPTDDRRGGTCL